MNIQNTLAAGLAALLLSLSAQAGDSDATKAAAPSTVAKADTEFFEKAAIAGMSEVQAGELANQRALGADVKSFGQSMASDHGAANEALKALATRKGVVLPSKLDGKNEDLIEDLRKADSKKFDEDYMKSQEKAHKDAVDLFTKTAKASKDPDIRAFASETLPTLQHHLAMAKNLNAKK